MGKVSDSVVENQNKAISSINKTLEMEKQKLKHGKQI